MSLTVSTSIPRTGSTEGGAPFFSVKVGGSAPLPLKVRGPKLREYREYPIAITA